MDINNQSVALWMENQPQGNQWKKTFVTIGDQSTVDYYVQINATMKSPGFNDISIDDISTKEGSCLTTQAPPTGETTPAQILKFTAGFTF